MAVSDFCFVIGHHHSPVQRKHAGRLLPCRVAPTNSADLGVPLLLCRLPKIAAVLPAVGPLRGIIMNAYSRRYLSVWLKRLSTDRIERRSSTPDKAPLIVVEPVKAALRICALNDAAAALGLKMRMPLADARAMHPSIQVENADPQRVRSCFARSNSRLVRPLHAARWLDPPDGLILDVSGCAHLF